MIPLLRTRTEHSYRTCYGPVELVADRLKRVKCPLAGCVDTHGTWGHVQWETALKERGITPAFGSEFALEKEDGSRPRTWALAEDIKAFYNFSSAGGDTEDKWANGKGIIRFAGHALTDPELFDYVDVNQLSLLAGKRAVELAKHTGKPLVLTPVNDYPAPEHRDRFLAWADDQKMAVQHIMSSQKELRKAFSWLTDAQFKQAKDNTLEIAERLQGITLNAAPIISVPGDLSKLVAAGKQYRLSAGHIKDWTPEYEARLKRELAMIKEKEYESYFIVVADLVVWAKQHMLVGPARGSSAGSLVCYLLRITEIDPLPHGLLFERFIDINRNDLPDIDIDFSDTKRHLVHEYLAEKYGQDCVAKIGNISKLKPRSIIAHVCKKMGINHGAAFPMINVLVEYAPGDARYGKELEDTLNNTEPGREFLEQYPEAALMGELENHASHTSVHAGGVIVSNVPVTDYCTVRDGVAQVDKKDAEILNLLKIDALGLKTLGVIEDAGCISAEKLYSLEPTDKKVFQVFNDGRFAGLFQFEGALQRKVSQQIPIKNFQQIDHITALARPGPLGGGATEHYIRRDADKEAVTYRHDSMAEYLSDTMGVVLYQEQVMRIVREIGGFSWEDTSKIRKAFSKSLGKEAIDKYVKAFIKGAARHAIKKEIAQKIWDEIVSFGSYGMNRSHTVSYAMISYYCAYMKCYHPLEYAAALMRNSDNDEQIMETLRELVAEGIAYVPVDPEKSGMDWMAKDGKLFGGLLNIKGIGPVTAQRIIEHRAAGKLTAGDKKKLAGELKYQDLRPAHTLWGDYYSHPEKYNIHGRIKEFADLQADESGVVICQLVRKERRDENEPARVARRMGKKKTGQTLFLDLFCVDDSVAKPIRVRIKAAQWHGLGQKLADRAVDNVDWLLVRGKWFEQFSMLTVEKIKCLTNPGIFL